MISTPSYYTRNFILLCIGSLFFFFSFNMILPELNGYIETLGGENYKGYILFLFTTFAALSRPFSGKMVDYWGRIPTLIFGASVACVASLFYPLASTLALFFALRCFHGLSTGFAPTGSAALMADIIPVEKRGEAAGMLGLMGSVGMALGPVLGSLLRESFGYNVMFFASSAVALLSVLFIFSIEETLPKHKKQKINTSFFRLNWKEIYEPNVLIPTLVFLFFCLGYGAVYAVVPDLAKQKFQVSNLGIFFMINVASSFVGRIYGGKISDRKGRAPVILVAVIILLISMLTIGFAPNLFVLYAGASLFGLATGINSPAIFAWTTDLSNATYRGRAFATLYIGMEIGIGFGAMLSTHIFNNNYKNSFITFFIMTCLSSISIYFLIMKMRKRKYSSKNVIEN